MEGILIFVLVNAIAVLIIWIFSALSDANKSQKEFPSILEKESKKMADDKVQELIFNQFKDYVLDIFNNRTTINRIELEKKLNEDYPMYKGASNELFYDLRGADLLSYDLGFDNDIKLGSSYQNLKLMYPYILEFLIDKSSKKEYKHNIPLWKEEINEAEVTSCSTIDNENSIYTFGICLGKTLVNKINTDFDNIRESSFYIYGKKINFINKNMLFSTYILMTNEINIRQKFNFWLAS